MSDCNCNLRTKLVGDGCEACNQTYVIDALRAEIENPKAANEQLHRIVRAELVRQPCPPATGLCNLCGWRWTTPEEQHSPDCLARPR